MHMDMDMDMLWIFYTLVIPETRLSTARLGERESENEEKNTSLIDMGALICKYRL